MPFGIQGTDTSGTVALRRENTAAAMKKAAELIADGCWIDHPGTTVFNLYRPPHRVPGNAANAQPWIEHARKVYPDDADHIIKWFAHRCQHPTIKINHARVAGTGDASGSLVDPNTAKLTDHALRKVKVKHHPKVHESLIKQLARMHVTANKHSVNPPYRER